MDAAALVSDLRAMATEFDAGISEAEWAALEKLLGYVEDDRLRIPENPDERDDLIDAFVVLGWCRPGAIAEAGGDKP